ncbi:hypothetical protein SK128_007530 [Halocaridina rubra]|uniref:Ionotropic glutamate receptor L-glutamate and glycine-binding domain-containing protein n=1 Tax=Halocaridina rubra TaxID=373956 RepID=A0AAN8X4M7_HALRR
MARPPGLTYPRGCLSGIVLIFCILVTVASEEQQNGWNIQGLSGIFQDNAPSLSAAKQVIHLVIEEHLPGCYIFILCKEDLCDMVSDIVSRGRKPIIAWNLDIFKNTPPPEDTYLFKEGRPKIGGLFCILFITLAPDLESVGEAFHSAERGAWFQGVKKYMLAYTGTVVSKEDLLSHPVTRDSYNLVVISQAPSNTSNDLSPNKLPRLSNTELWFQQICPYCDDGRPVVNIIAKWKENVGFTYSEPFYPELFEDFMGHRFKAVTLVYEPFSCYEKIGEDFIPTGNCVDNKMLEEMSRTLNFTYMFVEPKDGQWGHKMDNGSYTGVIGTVERLEADFSLNIAITQDREEKIDCTIGYHIEPITFATTRPRPLNQAYALIRPFRGSVWAAFGLTVLIAGPTYYIICKLASENRNIHSPSFVISCLLAYGTCLNQSMKWMPISSTRVFVVTYVMSMFVAVTMYVAMLTASLTLPALSPTLNTLEELVKSDFTWGIQNLGAADYQLLKSSKVPLYQRVFQGLKQCPTLDDCIIQARDTKYAFITWRTYLQDRIAIKFTSAAGEPQLHIASGDIFPVELGWAMNPGSPYRHKFNEKIRVLLESGFISKWLHQVINDPARRELDEKSVPQFLFQANKALGLHHLQGVFFVLIMGYALSCLVFCCENTLCKKSF